jgi:hypothetical protein
LQNSDELSTIIEVKDKKSSFLKNLTKISLFNKKAKVEDNVDEKVQEV